MQRPFLYKLPMGVIIPSLEGIRKRGGELSREIEDDMEKKRLGPKYCISIFNAWDKLSQKNLEEIYRTSKQAEDFSDSYFRYSRVMDIAPSLNYMRILSKIKGRQKYIDKLIDEAYGYEELARKEKLKPEYVILKKNPLYDYSKISKNLGNTKTTKVEKDKSRLFEQIISTVIGGILLSIALYFISKLSGWNL